MNPTTYRCPVNAQWISLIIQTLTRFPMSFIHSLTKGCYLINFEKVLILCSVLGPMILLSPTYDSVWDIISLDFLLTLSTAWKVYSVSHLFQDFRAFSKHLKVRGQLWPALQGAHSIVPFFQYSTREGYTIQQRVFTISLLLFIIGEHRGSQSTFQGISGGIKVSYLLQLTFHQGIPVGSWLHKMNRPQLCLRCKLAKGS